MKSQDYAHLIDKIRARLLGWSAKMLSFAGRLMLLKSVISSISNFWSSVFCLPKKWFAEIERLCNAFLWSGSPNQHHRAKVSWEDVCQPKAEGGLGIRKLNDTSKVFAYSLIWRLISSRFSLWVNWVRVHLLRHHSFWEAPTSTMGSWIWKKLLKLRGTASIFTQGVIRNGRSLSFWHDNWLPQGQLIQQIGESGPRSFGIPITATISEAVGPNGWRIRNRVRQHYDVVQTIRRQPIPLPENGPDHYLWGHSADTFKDIFSSSQTWEQTRIKRPQVNWAKLVWFKESIPRCSFITWLALRNRLSTGDRMQAWGVTQPCVFCGARNETRDHLFFACSYSFTLWMLVSEPLYGRSITPDWSETLRFLINGSFAKTDFVLLRLALQVTIERVWKERNDRRHDKPRSPVHTLYRTIDRQIRNRLHALNYTRVPDLQRSMERWLHGR